MTGIEPGHDHDEHAEWDERYAGSNRVWSGLSNGALPTELAGPAPARALDVGCGEGADAVWLAALGWDVTGLDVSSVALARAALHACEADVEVDEKRARHVSGGADAGAGAGHSHDLVRRATRVR